MMFAVSKQAACQILLCNSNGATAKLSICKLDGKWRLAAGEAYGVTWEPLLCFGVSLLTVSTTTALLLAAGNGVAM